jgi:hypothetical protein
VSAPRRRPLPSRGAARHSREALGRVVGKLDALADHEAGVLRGAAGHLVVPFSSTMTDAVHREVTDLAHWLDPELVLPD